MGRCITIDTCELTTNEVFAWEARAHDVMTAAEAAEAAAKTAADNENAADVSSQAATPPPTPATVPPSPAPNATVSESLLQLAETQSASSLIEQAYGAKPL